MCASCIIFRTRVLRVMDSVHFSALLMRKTNLTAQLSLAKLELFQVPRLELAAATVSVKMSEFLHQELPYTDVKEYFWMDSKIVLGYVNNEVRRFHVYVANRVQQIRDLANPSSWMYVDTDHASRGLTASQLLQGSTWLFGPEFLWKEGVFKPLKEAEI